MKQLRYKGQYRSKPRTEGLKALAISGVLSLSLYHGANFVRWLYEPYELHSPLGIQVARAQSPQLILQPATPIATVPTTAQLVDVIHMLETTRGQAKIGLQGHCAALGLSNEYGYGGMAGVNGHKICFANHAAATARITRWINEHMTTYGGDVARTLCSYNLGDLDTRSISGTCTYYLDALKVLK